MFAVVGCENAGSGGGSDTTDTSTPTGVSTIPADNATNVPINSGIRVTFSEDMDPTTIITANFSVNGGALVPGTVTYDKPNKTAVISPTDNMSTGTLHTATVTTKVTDLSGNGLAVNKVWTFTTAAAGSGPAPVALGTAGNFTILAKTAISTVPASVITGDVGISPAAESYLTGFSQTDATGYATSPQVTGFLYAADMTPPTPTNMTAAISDMELAYTDAKNRITPDFTDLGTGTLNADTLAPGLYKWGSSVGITGDITISGASNDVWIFQMTGDLSVAAGVQITLAGGAKASNIFWQVTGEATMEAGAHFEGIILSQTAITMNTGATMNGRALAQTKVALDQNTVTRPAF